MRVADLPAVHRVRYVNERMMCSTQPNTECQPFDCKSDGKRDTLDACVQSISLDTLAQRTTADHTITAPLAATVSLEFCRHTVR